MLSRSVFATPEEQARPLAGDALIAESIGEITNAITIQRPPRNVWPWLAQMGAGSRAGWYSYDAIDNACRPSANRILPGLQHIVVGTLFPALPGSVDGFTVMQFETGRHLVLGWAAADGQPVVTWAFVLEPAGSSATRLIVRCRASAKYSFHSLPAWIGLPIARAVHFVMERKQLLGIARRVEELDQLLDRFIPVYDVVERHQISVAAPPERALDAASRVDMRSSSLIRAIVKLRAMAMGDTADDVERPHGLVAETTSMGWRVLAEDPGREVVIGAAAQPWTRNVIFHPIAPEEFTAFSEPGYVKIAWTLRAESVAPDRTVFSTETRAVATDADARAKFRHYWHRVSPGVVAIRWILLRMLKKDAEVESQTHGRTD